eukprot:CAMPEP_0183731000 /NCGR_PEP_ID=MMETSP0737-20130205/34081_1 /TAXON_ID=385413 /ORGANISM="Thalassiosira miniscula, Strain CCMP1093" /LENGTH=53 /DNA_ID=CAMNT_0025963617 /DNA_START=98 /DNA_END=255 /DNA_ORIENTATION=+
MTSPDPPGEDASHCCNNTNNNKISRLDDNDDNNINHDRPLICSNPSSYNTSSS